MTINSWLAHRKGPATEPHAGSCCNETLTPQHGVCKFVRLLLARARAHLISDLPELLCRQETAPSTLLFAATTLLCASNAINVCEKTGSDSRQSMPPSCICLHMGCQPEDSPVKPLWTSTPGKMPAMAGLSR